MSDKKAPPTVYPVPRPHSIITGSLPPGYGPTTPLSLDDEKSSLPNSNQTVNVEHEPDNDDIDPQLIESVAADVKQTLETAGWLFVGRHVNRKHGTSIYLQFTTDGNPPNPNYSWEPQRSCCPYEDDFDWKPDPRHCKIRISDHDANHFDVAVFVFVSHESASCFLPQKYRRGKSRNFQHGGFSSIFAAFIEPQLKLK